MKLISHRGNINGSIESQENEPTYIDLAIGKGYDVEVDIWNKDGILWLGHDEPQFKVDIGWIQNRASKLWIHCKNVDAIILMNQQDNLNYFWHETDTIALTSLNFIWAYPGKQPIANSIAVMPELFKDDISAALGVCSDFVERYKL